MPLARYFLPAALVFSIGAFLGARALGYNLELAVLLPNVLILIVAALAERRAPYRLDWNSDRGDLRTDIASAATLFTLTDPLMKWGLPLLVLAMAGATTQAAGAAIFPTEWPFIVQVLAAAMLAEFTSYWSHRWHHRVPALWLLHALHHGSERLYWLNNFRIHPLNYGINYILGFTPLLLIGTPNEVVLGYLALTYPVLMLQHANLPLRSGWLNYVFSTNEVHRWHHSDNAKEGDSNFGRALVIWDQVFGTYRYSPQGNDPVAVGLYHPAQNRARFLPACCRLAS